MSPWLFWGLVIAACVIGAWVKERAWKRGYEAGRRAGLGRDVTALEEAAYERGWHDAEFAREAS
jgi:hypothetical protein